MSKTHLRIALAGNANVGKSVIFNQFTGLHQHIGNWPGKTIRKAEGTLQFKNYTIDFIDLPGIYSLSTFSIEEMISREYIANEKPDLVINVIDSCLLERNLFFTLQLLELEVPLVIALNQIDLAKKKGITIDYEKAKEVLGVPVAPTVAVSGKGLYELLEKAIIVIENREKLNPLKPIYGKEIEKRIQKLVNLLNNSHLNYSNRWVAIKLLEEDKEIEKKVFELNPKIVEFSKKFKRELEKIHGHSSPTIITSERYQVASAISNQIQSIKNQSKITLQEKLHAVTTHKIYGYGVLLTTLLSLFIFIFSFGDFTSKILGDFLFGFESFFNNIFGTGVIRDLVWGGIMEGFIGGITVALPYIFPFYLVLYLLEDSGYLSRIAFLMDKLMHKIGLHGKAFIPIMLSLGCNVPGCLGCRIMETSRERLLTAFVVTLVPCAATSVILLGLVGAFVNIQWALALYILNLILILIFGRIAFKTLPGEPTGLIMEMNDYKIPHMKTVAKQTWFRLKEFILMAFPLIIVGSFIIKLAEISQFLDLISNIFAPVTVSWLGLPAITGIALIFGILRKELNLIMLGSLFGTTNFALVMTSVQMIVFTIVAMLYIPCIATIGALVKEFGWKKAITISLSEILLALFIGGITFRLLTIVS